MRSKQTSHLFDVVDEERRILSVLGYWPKRHPTWAYKIITFFTWTIDVAFVVTLFAEVVKSYKMADYKAFTEVVSILTSFLAYVIKHIVFKTKEELFLELLDKLEDPVMHDFPRTLDAYIAGENRFALRIGRSLQFFAGMMVVSSLVKPFMGEGLAVQFTVFEVGAWFVPFHIFQLMGMASGCCNNCTFDCLTMALMFIGSTEFEILKQKLINCRQWVGHTTEEIDAGFSNAEVEFDPQFDTKLNEYLRSCVQHHLKIFDILDNIDTVFCFLILGQFATSVLAICNAWFQFMLETLVMKKIFLGCYSMGLLLQLSLFCVGGDQVMTKSQEIRDACYFSNWDKSDNRVRKTIVIMMERSKRPNLMTAGKIAAVNLPQYTSLMRMTYSYFALMNHMMNEG